MECFRKILFNNGTTYAGRSSPILHTLLNVSGRKRHSVSCEIVYPIKDSRPWKRSTLGIFTLLSCLFNPKSTKTPRVISSSLFLLNSYLIWWFLAISWPFCFFFVTRNQSGSQANWRYSSERRRLRTERKFSWQAFQVTSHPKSPKTTANEAQKIPWSWMAEKMSRQFS